jgi:hypothetical protein
MIALMRFLVFILCMAVFFSVGRPALAGMAEAREVARQNNCLPKKIEIYEQRLGSNPATLYKVACIEPKTVGQNTTKTPSAILVQCDANLCSMLRPLQE